ncbi:MAG: glycosyltransferase family 2 protein [Lentisphaeraceae bacterium]|nr:glycosyltransferase family 2 protein [Lentisphaeraceae bacterium]
MKFSIVIPAYNEEEVIENTLKLLTDSLGDDFDYEIVVVDDHCTDKTVEIVNKFSGINERVTVVQNTKRGGFGMAVRCGLDHYSGDAVAVYMADASDSPEDLISYFRAIEAGAECVFGSRFIKGSKVIDYPKHKFLLNRFVNWIIKLFFRHKYNDTTNAFKCYRKEVIEGCKPFISRHYNLTVELPLKAFIRGYKFEVLPISWTNRVAGVSKLKLKEMGSRYFFMFIYCLIEKWLTGADYKREETKVTSSSSEADS